MHYLGYFLLAAAIFAVIDLIWLGLVAKKFYRNQLGSLFTDKVLVTPAAVFYSLYIIGVIYFALNPALESENISVAVRNGALFGLITYATYDLTNWATLKNWPGAKLSVVDILWGTILTALTTVISFMLIQNF